MSYAIAAYTIALGSLAGYAIHLALRRNALRRELRGPGDQNRG